MKIYYSDKFDFGAGEGIYLFPDNVGGKYSNPWNDFGYVVTFNVYKHESEQNKILGEIKVLVKGEEETSSYFKKHGRIIKGTEVYVISKIFNPMIVVSMASSIEFYERIRVLFFENERLIDEYLSLVCDASFNIERRREYESWPGFSESIMRDGSVPESIIMNGYQIASGRYIPEGKFEIPVRMGMESFDDLDFKFDKESPIGKENVNLLIGRNGVGKSHVLNHISDVVVGLNKSPVEKWPYFNKLLVVACSPFEKFMTKNEVSQALVAENLSVDKVAGVPPSRPKINDYEYLGFRNESGDFDRDWPKVRSASAILDMLEYDFNNHWNMKRTRTSLLIETFRLSMEFDSIFLRLKNGSRHEIKEDVLVASVEGLRDSVDVSGGIIFEKEGVELPLSSGQAMYSYILPVLVSEVVRESLILIDEPELYLHPGMELGLLRMLKNLLKETNSIAILATHSAVLAREVFSESINILRRKGGVTEVNSPSIETYGASVDLIVEEVFDDHSAKKVFQDDIKELLRIMEYEDIVSEYSKRLGDDALIYLMGNKDNEN